MSKRLLLFVYCLLGISCGGHRVTDHTPHPEWTRRAVLYELNTRQFTPEGTFAAAQAHLPRLKDLGVDILWLMPLQPIGELERKGELGSYYSIRDYRAVNPEFGTMDDLRAFVSAAHALGLRVILDWVANHTARDAEWIGRTGWYVMDSTGVAASPYDWTDVAKLNFENPDMRREMIRSMAFWLEEADLDGFRCDVAGEVPTDFWAQAIGELKGVKNDIFMLAEAEKPELHIRGGFDASYAWRLHHIMNRIAQGSYNADSIRRYLRHERFTYPKGAIRLNFTSNHDENSWNGTEFERLGESAALFAAMCYVMPGMPLIYNGQEVGFDRRLDFFTKDSIEWVDRRAYTGFYRTLNRFKHQCRAVSAGEEGGDVVMLKNSAGKKVLTFARQSGDSRIVAMFNLSPQPVDATVSLRGAEGNYRDVITGEPVTLGRMADMVFRPWQFVILESNGAGR